MTAGCKRRAAFLPAAGAALAAVLLGGCPVRSHVPAAAPVGAGEQLAPHLGAPYDIVAGDSLLTVRVYRGGTLASAGHNHLIASHDLAGSVYVPTDPLRASVSARIPVAGLTVDEATLREEEMSADFPPQVPATAREGTRRNMLGEALLDAASSPEILLQSVALEAAPGDAGGDAGALQVLARIAVTVRGQTHTITVPVSYRLAGGQLTLTGESALRQSELGLTPFSALLGALQVQDEMRVRFRIVARAARSH